MKNLISSCMLAIAALTLWHSPTHSYVCRLIILEKMSYFNPQRIILFHDVHIASDQDDACTDYIYKSFMNAGNSKSFQLEGYNGTFLDTQKKYEELIATPGRLDSLLLMKLGNKFINEPTLVLPDRRNAFHELGNSYLIALNMLKDRSQASFLHEKTKLIKNSCQSWSDSLHNSIKQGKEDIRNAMIYCNNSENKKILAAQLVSCNVLSNAVDKLTTKLAPHSTKSCPAYITNKVIDLLNKRPEGGTVFFKELFGKTIAETVVTFSESFMKCYWLLDNAILANTLHPTSPQTIYIAVGSYHAHELTNFFIRENYKVISDSWGSKTSVDTSNFTHNDYLLNIPPLTVAELAPINKKAFYNPFFDYFNQKPVEEKIKPIKKTQKKSKKTAPKTSKKTSAKKPAKKSLGKPAKKRKVIKRPTKK